MNTRAFPPANRSAATGRARFAAGAVAVAPLLHDGAAGPLVLRTRVVLPALMDLPQRRHALPLDAAAVRTAGLMGIDPETLPPDRQLVALLGAERCLRLGVMPWRRAGGVTVILSAHAGQVRRHLPLLNAVYGPVRMAHAPEPAMHRALLRIAGPALVTAAETSVPRAESCRAWNRGRSVAIAAPLLCVLASFCVLFPLTMLTIATLWAALTLVLMTLLKATAAVLALRARHESQPGAAIPGDPVPAHLPVISLLVPLYHERAVASDLLRRLALLDYPRDRLDICLILEDDDATTAAALAAADLRIGALPQWLQVIEVPAGTLRTKPRALNYALNFARGSIVGIYDAEDAPAPRQLRDVVAHFARRGSDVACLQGALDYYNAESNWISRCFTLEYATWFRIVLPGLMRLGLVIPLGGTTLFLRRQAIEELGGWDAHNVTEDADLGLRLARHGYRTELIETVTEEEANARLWPWIKQRSRWLKGYAVTWAAHMRRPVALWRDLGTWRFLGVQLLFLGTLTQFVLAPLLWSFWPMIWGWGHPLAGILPRPVLLGLAGTFLAAEVVNIAISVIAARIAGRPRLAKWAVTLQLYYPLATLAAYKGLIEVVTRPYFWEKTVHGIFVADVPGNPSADAASAAARITPPPRPLRHPA